VKNGTADLEPEPEEKGAYIMETRAVPRSQRAAAPAIPLAGRRGDRPEAIPAPKTRQALPRRDKQIVGEDEATKESGR